MSSGFGERSGPSANSKEYGDNYANIDWSKKETVEVDTLKPLFIFGEQTIELVNFDTDNKPPFERVTGEHKMNPIREWSYDKPTQPGDYLCCRGDVETQANVTFERFHDVNGQLKDINYNLVSEYVSCFKFARLIYTSDELKGME